MIFWLSSALLTTRTDLILVFSFYLFERMRDAVREVD